MAVATPIVGTAAKVTFTPTSPTPGSEITLKNSTWKLQLEPNIKTSSNTTDGIVRASGLQDADGSVTGFIDTSQSIEADVNQGTIGTLKLYTTATKFWSLLAIIGPLNIELSTEDLSKWDFNFMLQSGTVTKPV